MDALPSRRYAVDSSAGLRAKLSGISLFALDVAEAKSMDINLSPDELEILNWLHVRVRGFGEKYLTRVSDLLASTEISPENYEKALSYLKAYKLVATGSVEGGGSSGAAKGDGIGLTHEGENLVRYHEKHPPS
jgi:hypothetical protein